MEFVFNIALSDKSLRVFQDFKRAGSYTNGCCNDVVLASAFLSRVCLLLNFLPGSASTQGVANSTCGHFSASQETVHLINDQLQSFFPIFHLQKFRRCSTFCDKNSISCFLSLLRQDKKPRAPETEENTRVFIPFQPHWRCSRQPRDHQHPRRTFDWGHATRHWARRRRWPVRAGWRESTGSTGSPVSARAPAVRPPRTAGSRCSAPSSNCLCILCGNLKGTSNFSVRSLGLIFTGDFLGLISREFSFLNPRTADIGFVGTRQRTSAVSHSGARLKLFLQIGSFCFATAFGIFEDTPHGQWNCSKACKMVSKFFFLFFLSSEGSLPPNSPSVRILKRDTRACRWACPQEAFLFVFASFRIHTWWQKSTGQVLNL